MEVSAIWTSVDQLYDKQISCPGKYGERALDCGLCDISISYVNIEGLAENYIKKWAELAPYFSGDYNGICRIGNCDSNVGRALERCLQSMLPDEVAVVTFSVVGADYSPVPKDCIVGFIRCQVRLNGVLNEKLVFELNEDHKYEVALGNKVQGVELFKSGHIVEAFLRFNKAIKYLVSIDTGVVSDSHSPRVADLTVILYNNMASCHLKRGNLGHVVTLCSKVLAVQPTNVKALFRRGVARAELRDFEKAKVDFQMVLQVEPGNVAAITKLGEMKNETTKIHSNYANVVKKMFEL